MVTAAAPAVAAASWVAAVRAALMAVKGTATMMAVMDAVAAAGGSNATA